MEVKGVRSMGSEGHWISPLGLRTQNSKVMNFLKFSSLYLSLSLESCHVKEKKRISTKTGEPALSSFSALPKANSYLGCKQCLSHGMLENGAKKKLRNCIRPEGVSL